MKELFKNFIKNKFNIALVVVQVLALISWALMYANGVFTYFFILLESGFFILWGIKGLYDSKKILQRSDQYADLPLTTEQQVYYRKRDLATYKNTKTRAMMLIVIGIVVLFLIFSFFN